MFSWVYGWMFDGVLVVVMYCNMIWNIIDGLCIDIGMYLIGME